MSDYSSSIKKNDSRLRFFDKRVQWFRILKQPLTCEEDRHQRECR